jgi:hypothetical protein
MHAHTLVLNRGYVPLYVEPYAKSVKKWYKGKAEILSEYADKRLQDWNEGFNAPAVIRLLHFMYPPGAFDFGPVPFTRENIWERDHQQCQYCGKHLEYFEMKWDHIVPKDNGGRQWWDNIVCCCEKCNAKKKNRTPEEAGMKLIKKPVEPAPRKPNRKQREIHNFIKALKDVKNITGQQWIDHIYRNVELEKE